MKKWIARKLRQLARWIEGPTVESKVLKMAKLLCEKYDTVPFRGEYKRHQVYKNLVVAFPQVPRRKLGLAIELVMNDGD